MTMKRTPMNPRSKPLRADPKNAKAWKDRSRKPLKPNAVRQAKRDARMRKWYASAEWKRQRQESLELAGHRCEYSSPIFVDGEGRPIEFLGTYRCAETTHLHVHEIRYKFEKSEPKDRVVYCKAHHELVELRDHPTRRRSQRKGGGR